MPTHLMHPNRALLRAPCIYPLDQFTRSLLNRQIAARLQTQVFSIHVYLHLI